MSERIWMAVIAIGGLVALGSYVGALLALMTFHWSYSVGRELGELSHRKENDGKEPGIAGRD